MTVSLAATGRGFTGRLQIQEGTEPPATREFEGDTCAEVVSALALLTALALDPNASSEPVENLPELAAPQAPRPTSLPPAAGIPAPAPVQAPFPWRASVGGRWSLTGWVSPGLLSGFDVFGEVWQERIGPFTPGFRLGLGSAWSSSDEARWRWYLARLDACPVRFTLSSSLWSQSCAGAELGAVHAEGLAIDSPHSSTQPWFAARLTTGLRFDTGQVFAGLAGGVVVPATRYRFHFDLPWREVHQVPPVGATIEVMAGGHLL